MVGSLGILVGATQLKELTRTSGQAAPLKQRSRSSFFFFFFSFLLFFGLPSTVAPALAPGSAERLRP